MSRRAPVQVLGATLLRYGSLRFAALRCYASLALLAGLVLAPTSARAQPREDVSRADALFNAAKALTDAGQYADACAKFAESKRLAPGIGVTLYLADCYERIGRTASAWTEFRSAEGFARARNDKRADVARDRAQALEAKLERLTIVVGPTVPRAGLQVLRDGTPVAAEELGLPVAVDPGDHAVVVSAPGHAPQTLAAHVGPENPSAIVRIDHLDEPASTPPAGTAGTALPAPTPAQTTGRSALPELPPTPAVPPDKGAARRTIGLGAGALGIVGLGIGATFGVLAKVKFDQSNSSTCDAASDRCTPPGFPMRKDAESAATVSDVSFAVGGALLAAGVVLYLTAPKPTPGMGLVVAPVPMAGAGGGAVVRAAF
jgi:hypothetical protein